MKRAGGTSINRTSHGMAYVFIQGLIDEMMATRQELWEHRTPMTIILHSKVWMQPITVCPFIFIRDRMYWPNRMGHARQLPLVSSFK